MKKLIILLVLLVGVSSAGIAQSTFKQGVEKKMGKKKLQPRKQMSHFDSQKKDTRIKNNGTAASHSFKSHKYTVDGNGYKSPKYFKDTKQTKGKRSRNKNFNTYTYK